jgi:hypothetical protein
LLDELNETILEIVCFQLSDSIEDLGNIDAALGLFGQPGAERDFLKQL